jgi:hypothetical protein
MNDTVKRLETNHEDAPKVRVFEASTGHEESKTWDDSCLLRFASQIDVQALYDGQVIHFSVYRKIHRAIRNFDRNEIHIYWTNMIGYDPVIEFNSEK